MDTIFDIYFKFLRILNLLKELPYFVAGRDSVLGVATGYGLDDREVGVRVPVGTNIFSTSSTRALGSTHSPIQWVPGALSSVVKRSVREAPACAEVRKMWIYTFTLPTPSWHSA
jgi:hypothetical protein